MDATHRCRERQSGAYNWEAWIKDTRDAELYRIVYMPDNKWWLAQNVKLANYGGSTVGSAISGCTKDECGRAYPHAQVYAQYAGGSYGSTGNVQGICPPGWLLPMRTTFQILGTSIGDISAVCAALRPLNTTCTPKNNPYGWASAYGISNGVIQQNHAVWYTHDEGREDGYIVDMGGQDNYLCDHVWVNNTGEPDHPAVVRCLRQL
jgi:uncharacterized protein (TIGR02145 family)